MGKILEVKQRITQGNFDLKEISAEIFQFESIVSGSALENTKTTSEYLVKIYNDLKDAKQLLNEGDIQNAVGFLDRSDKRIGLIRNYLAQIASQIKEL